MPVHNADIAAIFEEVADLLDIEGENEFRVRAYRNAARLIVQLSRPVADLIDEGNVLSDLLDIGKDLAGKMETIVETGTLPLLEELEQEVDPAMAELMDVPGLGPERVRSLHEALGVASREELREAAVEKGCFFGNQCPARAARSQRCLLQTRQGLGLKVAIGADAHWKSGLDDLRYGVNQARRGWLEPDDVLDTKPWDEIADLFTR